MDEQQLILLLLKYAALYPKLALFLSGMIALRLIMKPLSSFVHWWIAQTPSKRDDKKLAKFLANRYVKIILYIIDWLGSVKIKAEAKPNGGDNGSV
jgi:hypothetical protein